MKINQEQDIIVSGHHNPRRQHHHPHPEEGDLGDRQQQQGPSLPLSKKCLETASTRTQNIGHSMADERDSENDDLLLMLQQEPRRATRLRFAGEETTVSDVSSSWTCSSSSDVASSSVNDDDYHDDEDYDGNDNYIVNEEKEKELCYREVDDNNEGYDDVYDQHEDNDSCSVICRPRRSSRGVARHRHLDHDQGNNNNDGRYQNLWSADMDNTVNSHHAVVDMGFRNIHHNDGTTRTLSTMKSSAPSSSSLSPSPPPPRDGCPGSSTGILRVSTLSESLAIRGIRRKIRSQPGLHHVPPPTSSARNARRSLPQPNTARRRNSQQQRQRTTVVKFDSIEIYEHPIILGCNPAVSSGLPITIAWKSTSSRCLSVDMYESIRQSQRRLRVGSSSTTHSKPNKTLIQPTRQQGRGNVPLCNSSASAILKIPDEDRIRMLRTAGNYTDEDFHEVEQDIDSIRKSREASSLEQIATELQSMIRNARRNHQQRRAQQRQRYIESTSSSTSDQKREVIPTGTGVSKLPGPRYGNGMNHNSKNSTRQYQQHPKQQNSSSNGNNRNQLFRKAFFGSYPPKNTQRTPPASVKLSTNVLDQY